MNVFSVLVLEEKEKDEYYLVRSDTTAACYPIPETLEQKQQYADEIEEFGYYIQTWKGREILESYCRIQQNQSMP